MPSSNGALDSKSLSVVEPNVVTSGATWEVVTGEFVTGDPVVTADDVIGEVVRDPVV